MDSEAYFKGRGRKKNGTAHSNTGPNSKMWESSTFQELHAPEMASSSSSKDKGAAEEPEPEPGPPSGSPSPAATTAVPYDPRVYQPPHPDDRDGTDGKPTKKKGAKGKGKKGDGKGKGDDGTHRCGNCDAPDTKRKCNGCGVERYCGEECQKVRAVVTGGGYGLWGGRRGS